MSERDSVSLEYQCKPGVSWENQTIWLSYPTIICTEVSTHSMHGHSFIWSLSTSHVPCPVLEACTWINGTLNSSLHNNETRAVIRSVQIVLMGKQGKKLPAMSVRVRAGFLEEVTASWNESNSYRNREGSHSSGGTTQCNSTGVQKSPEKETVFFLSKYVVWWFPD